MSHQLSQDYPTCSLNADHENQLLNADHENLATTPLIALAAVIARVSGIPLPGGGTGRYSTMQPIGLGEPMAWGQEHRQDAVQQEIWEWEPGQPHVVVQQRGGEEGACST